MLWIGAAGAANSLGVVVRMSFVKIAATMRTKPSGILRLGGKVQEMFALAHASCRLSAKLGFNPRGGCVCGNTKEY